MRQPVRCLDCNDGDVEVPLVESPKCADDVELETCEACMGSGMLCPKCNGPVDEYEDGQFCEACGWRAA